MNYNGIKSDDMFLLAMNRFNDNKAFYEENKEQIKDGVILPLRRLVADLTPTMQKLNPDMILDPVKCISRVRRDTRYTHDKSLYRENMWIMFRHAKNRLPTAALWFEIRPTGFEYGCGILSTTPAFMEYYRKKLESDGDRFIKAVKPLKKVGFEIYADSYKKSKADIAGISGELKKWYDLKELFVIKRHQGIDMLDKPEELLELLKKDYASLGKLYAFAHETATEFNAENIK